MVMSLCLLVLLIAVHFDQSKTCFVFNKLLLLGICDGFIEAFAGNLALLKNQQILLIFVVVLANFTNTFRHVGGDFQLITQSIDCLLLKK